jgi:hypothetical protein
MSALLEAEHEDVEELAGAVLRTSFDLLLGRELWIVAAVTRDALWMHGPYFTRRQAEKALVETELVPRNQEVRLFIRRLISSTAGSDDE